MQKIRNVKFELYFYNKYYTLNIIILSIKYWFKETYTMGSSVSGINKNVLRRLQS